MNALRLRGRLNYRLLLKICKELKGDSWTSSSYLESIYKIALPREWEIWIGIVSAHEILRFLRTGTLRWVWDSIPMPSEQLTSVCHWLGGGGWKLQCSPPPDLPSHGCWEGASRQLPVWKCSLCDVLSCKVLGFFLAHKWISIRLWLCSDAQLDVNLSGPISLGTKIAGQQNVGDVASHRIRIKIHKQQTTK